MSLWEKWEREKLRRQGLDIRDPDKVDIQPEYKKPDIQNQIVIVLTTLVLCVLLIFVATFVETVYTGRKWSETFIVRLFVEKEQQRERKAGY